jgi:hypothetical protein
LTDDQQAAPTYLAYLIRLRRDSESTPWRVTVENPHTGERWGFATLRQFVEFLEKQTGERLRDVHSEGTPESEA